MHLASPDWLYHRLHVVGPAEVLASFRATAAGAGVVPWVMDYERIEEDWFHRLLAAGIPLARAHAMARQMREAAWEMHEQDLALYRNSHACPLDLETIVPTPPEVLRLGPVDPAALAWHWAHWGTTWLLRRVRLTDPCGATEWGCEFYSADWTPWPALAALRARFPALTFEVKVSYAQTLKGDRDDGSCLDRPMPLSRPSLHHCRRRRGG